MEKNNKTKLLLESAKFNTSHGDRLSSNDKKTVAREIASTDPENRWTEDALAEKLGITRQTVNIWISDIRARQKTGRNTVIIRLNRLGWPQEQIAKITGMTQGTIAQIINNANFCEINNLLSHGRDIAGRQVLTQEWWDQCSSSFDLVVSELVFQEANNGDTDVAQKRLEYIKNTNSLA